MNKIKKIINSESILYLIFGGLTTLVDFVSYFILTRLSVNYMIANVIAWIFAVAFAYITNKIYVFNSKTKDKDSLLDEIISFVSARLFSLVFSLVFIYIAVTLLGTDDFIAKVLSSVFVVIINYFISKFYIFKKDTGSKKTSFLDFLVDNISLIISFVAPLVILVIIYHARKIYPFGDSTYLRSDCYHQYAPFMKEFFNKIKNGGSMVYSWNIGMGVNFSALYAYYLASPVNWLIGLVSPNHIPEAMNVFIMVKIALCSLTFAYYLSKHFQTKKLSIACFSILYALSSYICAFCWNLMWLDCLVLLPLIVLGLEKLVKEDKCYLYCISLGIAILSNYYIAIMICIFCVIYFVALIYCEDSRKTIGYLFTKFKNFAIFSLLAGGMAAITILPAYFALSSTASGEFGFPKEVITYFSIMDMLSRSLINVEPAIFSAHDPNLFCGTIILLLVPVYAVNPKIKFKEKVAKLSILAFFLYSFNTNIPNYIWHGFHFPNSLPCRESFIYIFLILAVSYDALHNIKEITRKQLCGCFFGAVAFLLIIEELYVGEEYPSKIIYFSLMYLVLYLITFFLIRSNQYKQNFVYYLLFIIVVSEAYVNTNETGFSTCTRSYYLNDNPAIETLLNEAKKEEGDIFFGTEKAERRTKNDAAWNNYYGASTFSSTANAGLSKYYGSIGMEESTNAYAYYGHTPLTEAMFSIKYVLSSNKMTESKYTTLFANTTYDVTDYLSEPKSSRNYYMYKNNYWLPMAFMLPEDMESKWDNTSSNPFDNLNSMYTAITGDETNMYDRLDVTTISEDNNITVDRETHMFIYVTTSLDSINVKATKGNVSIINKNYYSMTHSHILDLGILPADTTVTVHSTDDSKKYIQLYAYSCNDELFDKAFNVLNESTFEQTYFSDTLVKGNIDVKKSGTLYTSIPYDEGWTVKIDGKKVKTHAFKDALLSIELSEGQHKIEFSYEPKGRNLGIIVSISSAIVLILIMFADFSRKRRNSVNSEAKDE